MLACIPTAGNSGLEDVLSDHFGSAPYFTLYDSTTDELTIVENRNIHHSHGACHPMNQLRQYPINCIVCCGMGRRAIDILSSEGIKVYRSETDKVKEVIEEIKTGNLTEIDPAEACRGHGQSAGRMRKSYGYEKERAAGHADGRSRRQSKNIGRGRMRGRD